MSELDGFEIIESINGMLTMTITKNGVAFNKTVLEKLKCPENVIALLNKNSKRFAIKPCMPDDLESRAFYNPGRPTSYGVRWNNHDLRTTLETIMGWNLKEQGWRIRGVFSGEDNAVIFDLNSAEVLEGRTRRRKEERHDSNS